MMRNWLKPKVVATSLGLAFVLVAVATWRDYGVIWDEHHSLTHGKLSWAWYLSGFTDSRILSVGDFYFYGSFVDMLSYLAALVLPFGTFESSHLVTLAFGFIGLIFAYKLGNLLAGGWAGALSMAFLLATPVYYGHSFMNPKDLPFAVLYLISLHALAKLLLEPSLRWKIFLGLSLGLLLSVRIGGMFSLGVAAALILARGFHKSPRPGNPGALKAAASDALAVSAIAWAVMLAFWPSAQLSPILHPLRMLLEASRFHNVVPNFFEGAYVNSNDLAWNYVPRWLLSTLPDFFYASLSSAALVAVLAARRAPLSSWIRSRASAGIGLLLLFSVVPAILAIVTRASLYDAIRHLLFIFPPLMILSAIAITLAVRHAGTKSLAAGAICLTLVSYFVTVREMARAHPYEYVYANHLIAGGSGKFFDRFDHDYWGLSLKEASLWLATNAERLGESPIRVFSTRYTPGRTYFDPAEYFLSNSKGSFTHVRSIEDADVYVGLARSHRLDPGPPGQLLYEVKRHGHTLAFVSWISKTRALPQPN